MTTAAETAITAKLKALGTAQLKEVLTAAYNDTRDGAEIVLRFAMNELERRIPEVEFVAFLDRLS